MSRLYTQTSPSFKNFRLNMATRLLVVLVALMVSAGSNGLLAQLSGVKNIPGDYADLAAAITDLNTVGVGAGGVTFNLLAGNPQTTPSGGYSINTASSTMANPIIFNGNGNTITASAAQTAGALNDGIFKIIGTDYVTIDGFVMQENAANTITAAGTNTMTEWGVALLYATTTNGSQNCTIQNNTISLNRTYQNTFGIYSNSTHSATVISTTSSATTAAGGNSNLVVRANNISNVNIGVVVVGPTAAADYNQSITIGGNAAADGNTLTNYGTTGTFSSYVNVSGTVNGILVRNSVNYNISRNSITSSVGGTTAGTLRGIFVPAFSAAPTGTLTNTINNNTIALTQGASNTLQGITVEGTTSTTTSTNNISNNNFTTMTYSNAGASGTVTMISTVVPVLTLNVTNNTFTNLSVNTTGSVTFVAHSYTMPVGTTQNFDNNAIVTGFTKTGAGGSIIGFTSGSSSANGSTSIMTNNNLSNITVTGATAITGITNTDGSGSSPNRTVTGNNFSNWTGGTSALTGMTFSYIGATSTISNNTVTNLTGQAAITGIIVNATFNGGNPLTIANNTVNNLVSTGTGGAVVGISTSNTSPIVNINNNVVHTLSSTGAVAVNGITISGAANTSVFKNKVYNLSGSNASSTVNGILVSAGTTVTVTNNLVGDLRTPAANAANPLNGINITGGTTVNVFHNTVYLNGNSTGALFGSSAVSASTTPTLTLRNNIFVNLSGFKGTGNTVAYRRSTTTLTSYAAASNNNLFYAGGPCANRLIFFDGTNSDQTLAAYKTRVAARDAASVTEDPRFTSTAGANAGFLHINTGIATQIESGAVTVAGVTDDYDGDVRGGTPDIGADEFTGVVAVACAGTPVAGTASGTSPICSGNATDICLTGQSAEVGISVKWQSSTTLGGPYTDINCAGGNCFNTGPLVPGTYYYRAVVTCENSGESANSNEVTIVVNPSPTVMVSPTAPTICNGTSVVLTASGALSYAWTPATGLNTTTGSVVTASPTASTTYTVTGSDAIGCIGTATATVTVTPKPIITASATPTSICPGGTSQLNSTVDVGVPYSLSSLTGQTYTTLAGGGITIINTDAQLTPGFGGGTQDDGGVLINIPFTFSYMGNNFTQMSMSTNGWVAAGNLSTIGAADSRTPGNFFTTTAPNNTIAAWFKDMGANFPTGTGSMRHGLIGTDVYAFQWDKAVGSGFSDGSTILVSFQVNIHGPASATPGRIEIIYGPTVGAISFSAAQGIEDGVGGTNRYINALTGTGNSTTLSTVWPGDGNGYRFTPTPPSYSWSPATFLDNAAISNPVASNVTATTTYTLTVTGGNGCTATATATVSVNPTITITETDNSGVANNDNIICAGSSATLTAVAPGAVSFNWSSGDNTAATTVSPASTTTYTVTVSDGTCTNTATLTITVNPLPTPGIMPAETSGTTNNDGIICIGATATLTASGGTSYMWNTGENTAAISVTPNTTTTYTVTVTNANGCSATATRTIVVNPLPTPSITPSQPAICSGQSVQLTADGGTSYLWSTNEASATITVSPAATTTYTVTVTNANGCSATATVSVTVNAAPTYSVILTQPTSCSAINGNINLTVTGGVDPFTFAWTTSNGCGLFPYEAGDEDQDSLCVGTYNVVITGDNGCTTTGSISLSGPGGCFDCPTFGALTVNPTADQCAGETFTLTQSGMTDMGSNYGIIFKSFPAPTADPYTGGTVLATVPNASLTGGGSTATATVSIATAGSYTIYAILTPTPSDGNCRPTASVSKTIKPIPNAVATPASNALCSDLQTDIVFSGNVPNTVYTWTRDNVATVTGIAANGVGNISGVLTNTTNANITVTFTVTPSANGCTGTPITVPILVHPVPVVDQPINYTFCSGTQTAAIVFTGSPASATFRWTNNNTAIGLGNLGNGDIPSFLATNNTPDPISATITVTPQYLDAQTQNLCFGAPKTFTITILPTPNAVATPASQTICSGTAITTIALTGTVNGTTYNWTRDNTGTVTGIAATGSGNISGTLTNTTNAPVTVTFTITPVAGVCSGTPITATVLVNPTPNAVATPASQTICSGNAITTIALTGNVTGTTFNWVRNNAATVTGIAASGAGNISGTLVNTTNAPITVTFTITPTANNCNGAPITATVLVNPTPLPFNVTGGGVVCNTDNVGVTVDLSGSQTNVNYQLRLNGNNIGAPVAGTGGAISFGPQLGAGTYTVIATHTQGGCTAVMTGTATISTFNCSVSISDPCVCLNNPTTLENGQFRETIKVNAPGTQTWTVTAVNGLFDNGSLPPPFAPFNIAVGTQLTNLGVAMNMFQLIGKHVDAIGYTISVSNGRGTTLSIGNSCAYPNPAITSDLNGEFCLFSDPVTLTGTPGDANFVSQGFTVNGVPATQFNPSQGVGTYTIVYSVNGGTPKAFGANDPGCVQTVSQVVTVVQTPTNVQCNDVIFVSLDGNCVGEVLPDDVLEGSYGCYDDYLVELDKTPPFGNGPWVPAILGPNDAGKTYQTRITHLVSNNKCWGSVVVEDKIAPTLVCEDITLVCPVENHNPNYLANTLGFASAIPTGSDCSTYTINYIDTKVDLSCNSSINGVDDVSSYIQRKWTAVDIWGNSSTCLQFIYLKRLHVSDVQIPDDFTISCTANSSADPSVTGAPYFSAYGLEWPINPGAGYCEVQSFYEDVIINICDGTYKIARTWTVLDWCLPTNGTNNPLIFTQIIKVLDEEGPDFVCPANLTVSIDPFACCATTNLPDVILEDNCSRINNISGMVVTFDPSSGDQTGMHLIGGNVTDFPGNNWWDLDTLGAFGSTPCLPQGTHTVTYMAEDDCGNTSSCSFRLTVADYVPPVAACDQETTVGIGPDDPADCYGPAGPGNVPVALDGCEFGGVTWVKATTFNDGSYDQCNNVKFTVRRMAPYSDCINALNATNGQPACDDENPDFPSEFERATAEGDSIKFYCCEVGTTQTVILRVYQVNVNGGIMTGPDGLPLFNECMIQVEVQDKVKPVCQAPANVTVTCEQFDPSLWLYGKAEVLDNCCLDETKVYQEQCGLTHAVNYAQFDTVCNKGTITRTFRAFDCHGQSSQCTQRIVVTYEQDYYVRFPNDVIVTVCDGTGNYGEPSFFGEDCELLGVTFEDEIFTVVPDACFKIERNWKIINWCTYVPEQGCTDVPNPNPNAITNHPTNLPGPIVSPVQLVGDPWKSTIVRIAPTDPTTTNFSVFYNPNVNCYTYKQIIKIIDTQDPIVECPASPVTICDLTANDPQLWNEMYWWDNANQSHDLCEAPADICLTATDACSGANINFEYQLFLDLDGDGVMETVVNSTQLGSQPGGLGWNNILFGNATGVGQSRQFDGRPVPTNQKWGFAIQETVTGNNKTACVKFNTFQAQNTYVTPQLPYGNHKIKWFVTDGCGNETICEYTIVIKDCKAPTVVCLNGLSVNIMPTGMITLWATDFLQYAEDNCTQTPYLKYGVRKCGQGTGFPVDSNGDPITNVTFDCTELGTQCVELWAIDLAGNADYCETYVIVQDNAGSCPIDNTVIVSGALKTEMGDGIDEAEVFANVGVPPANIILTDNSGVYQFNNIPVASDVSIIPTKDDNPLNGVTTYDLVLISKHILGIEPLNSPYKMIAADANKSNSITTFDIVEIRKLILGIYQELPNNTSWRFVDEAYVFPNPLNPFQAQVPYTKTFSNIFGNKVNEDFVGIKVGDVNNTAVANSLMTSDDRSEGTLLFDVTDREVQAGDEFEVAFTAADKAQGYQMTLNLNGLTVLDGKMSGENVTANNFGVFADALTVSIDGAESFTVTFRATKSGKLSQMLGVSSRITKAEAYSVADGRLDVALRFNSAAGATTVGVGFELYQNQPNPFVNKTFVGFNLPAAAAATLTVYDETGRVVYTQKGDFAKGYNAISLDRALLNTTGVLYYTLETATDTATKKMIQTK